MIEVVAAILRSTSHGRLIGIFLVCHGGWQEGVRSGLSDVVYLALKVYIDGGEASVTDWCVEGPTYRQCLHHGVLIRVCEAACSEGLATAVFHLVF